MPTERFKLHSSVHILFKKGLDNSKNYIKMELVSKKIKLYVQKIN